jgi:hypothetical protein
MTEVTEGQHKAEFLVTEAKAQSHGKPQPSLQDKTSRRVIFSVKCRSAQPPARLRPATRVTARSLP